MDAGSREEPENCILDQWVQYMPQNSQGGEFQAVPPMAFAPLLNAGEEWRHLISVLRKSEHGAENTPELSNLSRGCHALGREKMSAKAILNRKNKWEAIIKQILLLLYETRKDCSTHESHLVLGIRFT